MSDTFKGLDNLILDQPDLIDLGDEPKTDPAPEGAIETDKDADKNKAAKTIDDSIDIDTIEDEDKDIDEGKVDKVKKPENKSKDDVTQEDLLKGWGDYFKENSILGDDDLEEFDGTPESLIKAFEKREVRTGMEMVDDYKSQLPPMLKYLAENWEEGVPLDELLNIKSNQIRYSNVTDERMEDSVDTQKAVQAEYLRKTTKFSESKIEKEINRLVDLDELKDESKESLKELKQLEAEAEEIIKKETKSAREARIKENQDTIKLYDKYAKSTKEVIPGLKIDDKVSADVFNKTVNPIGVDGNGNHVSYIQSVRSEDPIAFDYKLNYLITITKGLTDFSKITNGAVTKATKDLSKIIGTAAPKTGADNIDTSEKKNVLDYLKMPQNRNK